MRTAPNYTVRRAAEDWLREGLAGRSPKTVKKNENVLAPILAVIGGRRLRELTAGDVHHALTTMAERYSSAAVAMGHNALTRTIRHAEARDLVGRNVATLVDTPKGQAGRPSKSLTLEQASALLAVTEGTRMHAYISLCLATGIRTEEARELRWDHVDFGDPSAQPPAPASAAVWRSVRADGDTKTEKSRRTLGLPQMAVDALRAHKKRQAEERPPRAGNGAITISSSPPGPAAPWTRLTSGGSSKPRAGRRRSGTTGRRGSCGTLSCRSCPARGYRSRRSRGWPGTLTPGLQRWSTGESCDRS